MPLFAERVAEEMFKFIRREFSVIYIRDESRLTTNN